MYLKCSDLFSVVFWISERVAMCTMKMVVALEWFIKVRANTNLCLDTIQITSLNGRQELDALLKETIKGRLKTTSLGWRSQVRLVRAGKLRRIYFAYNGPAV